MNRYIVLDVETVANAQRVAVFDNFNEDKFRLDEYWIKKNPTGTYPEWRKFKMGTTPEYLLVVGLNWGLFENGKCIDGPSSWWVGNDVNSEKELLQKFNDIYKVDTGPTVVFNGLSFDLPVLKYRAVALGVKLARGFVNLKPWEDVVIDEYARMYAGQNKKSMKELRTCLMNDGVIVIPEKYTKVLSMEGDSVSELYSDKNFHLLKLYGELDVVSEAEIYRVFKGLWW